MLAILRREFNAYFSSPLGYIFLATFFALTGFTFYAGVLVANSTDISPVFSSLNLFLLILIPILTMRLFSEEKRQKTDQSLLTAPVSLSGIVYGKFLAAVLVFSIAVAITLVYAVIVAGFGDPGWPVVFGNILGLLLMGSAMIAIGLFMSSLTENQLIAAVGSFAIILIFILLQNIASLVPFELVSKVLTQLSFNARYITFTTGVLNISNVIFFLSIIFIFNFLTVRALEVKRWGR